MWGVVKAEDGGGGARKIFKFNFKLWMWGGGIKH